MWNTWASLLAITLQVLACLACAHRWSQSRDARGWVALCAANALMAVRRITGLYLVMERGGEPMAQIDAQWMPLAISFLMAFGTIDISLRAQQRPTR